MIACFSVFGFKEFGILLFLIVCLHVQQSFFFMNLVFLNIMGIIKIDSSHFMILLILEEKLFFSLFKHIYEI